MYEAIDSMFGGVFRDCIWLISEDPISKRHIANVLVLFPISKRHITKCCGFVSCGTWDCGDDMKLQCI